MHRLVVLSRSWRRVLEPLALEIHVFYFLI